MKMLNKQVTDNQMTVSFHIDPITYQTAWVNIGQQNRLHFDKMTDAGLKKQVMAAAIRDIDFEIPETMIQKRLEALLVEEKIKIGQDPIYNVLANFVEILGRAYKATGVFRSPVQVKSEGLDVMLLTLTGDHGQVSQEVFFDLIKHMVRGYREIPDDFENTIKKIIDDRQAENAAMSPEMRMDDVFSAYLGSREITENQWMDENRVCAIQLIKEELFLDAVGEAENIVISREAVDKRCEEIAKACDVTVAEVKGHIHEMQISQVMIREQAEERILAYALNKGKG